MAYSKQDIQVGVEMFCQLAEYLNNIISETNDEIQINNHELWNTWLHSMTNDDWRMLCYIISELEFEKCVTGSDARHFDKIKRLIDKYESASNKVMDLDKHMFKGHKTIAWHGIMTVREVYNRARDIYLPNKPGFGKDKGKPDLFLVQ